MKLFNQLFNSINQWNITKIKTILHCMVKQFLFHKENFPKPDWQVVRHVSLQIKKKTKKKAKKKNSNDCEVCTMINIYTLQNLKMTKFLILKTAFQRMKLWQLKMY